MFTYSTTLRGTNYTFVDLKDLLAKATPLRSGDQLAGVSAASARERVAAQMVLADVPLERFLQEPVIPFEKDEVTRLILDRHDRKAFAPVANLTVGQFREWLLEYTTTDVELTAELICNARISDAGSISQVLHCSKLWPLTKSTLC